MMTRNEQARLLHDLHVKGNPLIVFNIWDAGSAKALQEVGAKVIATGSWSVAAAHGYEDREKLPFDLALANLRRITASVDLPVTIDIEKLCARSPIPVNIMIMPDAPSPRQLADLGVARISYGPRPYRQMIEALKEAGRQALSLSDAG